jgi:hypothetical protein
MATGRGGATVSSLGGRGRKKLPRLLGSKKKKEKKEDLRYRTYVYERSMCVCDAMD